jgi:hypothetical protein
MKALCFTLGVIATLVVLIVSGALRLGEDAPVARGVEPPLDAERVQDAGAAARKLPVGKQIESAPIATSPTSVERVSIPSVDELERRIIEQIIADLPPDWVTPIDPPATGSGPTKGGLPHGEWSIHYPQNDWTVKGRFVLGSKQGRWECFDRHGELFQIRHYRNGKLDGELKERDDDNGDWNSWQYRVK